MQQEWTIWNLQTTPDRLQAWKDASSALPQNLPNQQQKQKYIQVGNCMVAYMLIEVVVFGQGHAIMDKFKKVVLKK